MCRIGAVLCRIGDVLLRIGIVLCRIGIVDGVIAFGGESSFEVWNALIRGAEAHFGGAHDAPPVGQAGVSIVRRHEPFVVGVCRINRIDEVVDRLQSVDFGRHSFGDGLVILRIECFARIDVDLRVVE